MAKKKKERAPIEITDEEYDVVNAPEQDTFNEEDMRIEGEVEHESE